VRATAVDSIARRDRQLERAIELVRPP
jgi:hypothetical protein